MEGWWMVEEARLGWREEMVEREEHLMARREERLQEEHQQGEHHPEEGGWAVERRLPGISGWCALGCWEG